MKLCNVCGKELKRKHPGCNAKAERAKLFRAPKGETLEEVIMDATQQVVRVYAPALKKLGDPLSRDIASMGQPARDAILRRMVTQREKR